MIVNLHIERLVIDGLAVGRHDAPVIGAALSAELTRLITEGGLGEGLERRHFDPAIRAESITPASRDATGVGTQVGQAILGVIGR